MILAGLAYRNVGQPRFFLFPGNAEAVVSGSTRGASPACPCSAGTTAFGNRTRSQPRQRGCSKGLGCFPTSRNSGFRQRRELLFRVFVYTKTLLATFIPKIVLYRNLHGKLIKHGLSKRQALFSPPAVGSRQKPKNEVDCFKDRRRRNQEETFLLLPHAESNPAGVL